ncbi:MAG: methionine aminotransferase [Flavobacteriales bacterium]
MQLSIHHSTKFPSIKTTIFTTMSALAREHNAVNLSQGFPDFEADPALLNEVKKAMKTGHNQYAPMAGLPLLRERIAAKTEAFYSASYNPETEITVTAGATQAIFTAVMSVVRPKDEVIILEPAYDCYAPAVELAGGICKHVPLTAPDYSVPWDVVRKFITKNTKMLIINTPHNPTGSILNAADMQKLEKLLLGTDIIVLSDEVYEHILFDGYEHQSVARFPGLAGRSFVVSSFGKSYHTTGWKIGYVLAPEALTAEFRKVHQYNVFAVNTPMQYAFAEMLARYDDLKGLSAFYQAKRDLFLQSVKASRFTAKASSGTYFQNICYKKISEENDLEFAMRLTREHKIASIPLSVFYTDKRDEKMLRFCFAKNDDTLKKAADILCRI